QHGGDHRAVHRGVPRLRSRRIEIRERPVLRIFDRAREAVELRAVREPVRERSGHAARAPFGRLFRSGAHDVRASGFTGEAEEGPCGVHRIEHPEMKRIFAIAAWGLVALAGAGALAAIAQHRGESLNATWFIVAAV